MVNIKRRVNAYILLEALLAMAVLVTLASLVLVVLNHQQAILNQQIREQEILTTAIMAVQSGHEFLEVDGITIDVWQDGHRLIITHDGEEVLSLEKY